jgi:cytochrome c biogenesis protein CcmG/thiol:disulfide interchange protein DsbE
VEEAPGLGRIYQRYKERNILFVGIYLQDTEEAAREHLERFGLTFTNGIDANGSIAGSYEVSGIPAHVFVDTKGRISFRHIGPLTEKELSQRIEEILE